MLLSTNEIFICDKPMVIIILGKGVIGESNIPTVVQHEINYAINLSRTQPVHAIIFSGDYWGFGEKTTGLTEAAAMKQYALTLQPPAKLLLLTEELSKDTIGNLVYSKKIIDQYGWKEVLILTTATHLARVQYITERVFGQGYKLMYHGHEHSMTVWQYFYARRYERLAWWYMRYMLWRMPSKTDAAAAWLQRRRFIYQLVRWLRPAHR